MTQVWVYGIGEASGEQVGKRLRDAGVAEFELRPWAPFLPGGADRPVLVLSVGDWRKFTRRDYFAAAHALVLHQSGAVRFLPILEAGSEETPQAEPWQERYRLLWQRLASASQERLPEYQGTARPAQATHPVSIFFSYCHRDEALRDELGRHLRLLERTGLIRSWNDQKIVPGDDWAAEIDNHLYTADLILLLLSSDFFASEFCSEIETPIALERHKAKAARAIPILLRPVAWSQSPLAALGALPRRAIPVTEWPSTDAAFVNVCEGILSSALAWSGATEAEPDLHGAPPPAPRIPRPATRKRTLDAAMPAKVEVSRAVMLVVLVRKASSPGLRGLFAADPTYGIEPEDVKSQTVVVDFPLDPITGKPGALSAGLTVTAPDFEPAFLSKPITLAPDGDSLPCIFLLAAKRPGQLVVLVEAFQGDRLIVSCPIRTVAATEDPGATTSKNIASASFESQPPANGVPYLGGEDLQSTQASAPTQARPVPPPQYAAPRSPSRESFDYPVSAAPPQRRSGGLPWLVIAALLLGALVLFFLLRR